jgi:ABC-2 type transport system permease protein
MRKTGIVIRREYLHRVNKKSFILLTIFAPFLFAALVFVPLWLSSIKSDETFTVAIVDRTGKYVDLFTDTDHFHFESADRPQSVDTYKENSSGIFAFLEITDDLLVNPKAVTLYSEKQIPSDLRREVNNTLSQFLEHEKRASFNIPNLEEIIKNSRVTIDVQTIKWGRDGTATESSSELASAIGFLFTLIIFMFIMMYGAMVMQGVMEEKTNRIVEVMVSSVRPFDLMMGKIVGLGLVGLTQLFIWGVLTMILVSAGGILIGVSAGQNLASMPGGLAMNVDMTESQALMLNFMSKFRSINLIEITVYFVLFFIGGYISYSSIYAAIGAAVDSPEDAQQFMTPMMFLMLFAFYAGIYSMGNPDGPLAFWCSFIPLTSPVVMMMRIPYEIPFWQILTSLALLFASAIVFVWGSAKIYRVGILMYGKKRSFKEIIRWVKY